MQATAHENEKFMWIRLKHVTSISVILKSIIWWKVIFSRLGKGFWRFYLIREIWKINLKNKIIPFKN